jgi:diketogulonate reductase-like aldo/keto reductase
VSIDEPRRPAVSLSNGVEMPLLGLGVWQVADGEQTENAVTWALEAGYRHVDTAQLYGNETAVGRAIRASGRDRADVFITTKLHPRARKPARALNDSLGRLGTDHVDLFLIHWPTPAAVEQWAALERAYDQGVVRAIGVSNWGHTTSMTLWPVLASGPTSIRSSSRRFSSGALCSSTAMSCRSPLRLIAL